MPTVEAATNSGAGVIGGYIGVKAPNAVEKTGRWKTVTSPEK